MIVVIFPVANISIESQQSELFQATEGAGGMGGEGGKTASSGWVRVMPVLFVLTKQTLFIFWGRPTQLISSIWKWPL